ncbi:hypothetical protein N8A98_00650 (plasmid) [Devosia neptuniae]|uniref:Growth inhibitor PemK n=1 Tax=Devosia neptuniae TaxID=191302 RepID=A0ABY6C736_9HYPH|nr:hypothetical protein [Devosia neptuniae]UXN68059.1 hypothetical protein N8A98_00650 [Devosia neptuniae]
MADIPPNGSIIRYAYLWKWQRDNHETEGRKERPVCLTLSLPHGDQTAPIMLAISGTPPRSDQTTLVIPELERRRAGLSAWKDAWITVSEYNFDIAEKSYYTIPIPKSLARSARGF